MSNWQIFWREFWTTLRDDLSMGPVRRWLKRTVCVRAAYLSGGKAEKIQANGDEITSVTWGAIKEEVE
jgi:hypothetical protein